MSEGFRRYMTWDRFQQHVTQTRRRAAADYKRTSFSLVRIYEFFMPLTNEDHLRSALDALFYRDSVEARLRTLKVATLHRAFPKLKDEAERHYLDRLCLWISQRFVGYSVYHVNGRFRAQELLSRADAGRSERYLVDETTAVARFIFPCESTEESERIEFFFRSLFVESIIEIVNAEDEIWMVETGVQNQLHIWQIERSAL